jgi:Alginate export
MFKRFPAITAMVFLVGVGVAVAQSNTATDSNVPDRTYKLLREDEDWSFLEDRSLRQDFWDPVKYIPIGNSANWYMTIGGEAREVWEQIGNDNWGQSPYMNGYLNERYLLSFDLHYGSHLRTFFELKSGLNSFRFGGPRPIDEKKLDFQAGFLEAGTSESDKWIKVRAGRQEMEYGSGRLIDVREGPNVQLSFDGFKVMGKINSWRIDGFAMRPDEDNPGFFDNAPNHQVGFWGIYATGLLSKSVSLDAYYLGLDRKSATFQRGTAQELRHSVGARLSRPIATERPAWDFDYEALWQFGTFGSANIRAWTVASETGYRLPTMTLKPRFSVKADISSGDHPNSNTLGTFNALFPKGNYFGVLATTGPGPLNFIDFHPRIEGILPHNITASFDWIVQWRESLEDGVYAVPGFLIRAADGSRARFVGHRPGTELRWQVNAHLWFQGDYGIFYAGRFLKETKPGRNLNYWALWAGYKF